MPIIGSSRSIPKKNVDDAAAEALALLTRAVEFVDDPSNSDSLENISTKRADANRDSKVMPREENVDIDFANAVATESVTRKSRNTSSNEKLQSSTVSVPMTKRSSTRKPSKRGDMKSSMRLPTHILMSSSSNKSSSSKLSPAIKNNSPSKRSDSTTSTRLRPKRFKPEVSKSSSLDHSEGSSEDDTHMSEAYNSLFEVRFKELLQFQKENGHCLVPKKYPANPSLSYFVFRIRGLYNKRKTSDTGYLTKERIKRLNKIGFTWYAKSTDAQKKIEAKRREPLKNSKWDSFFEQFVQFQKQFGSSLIPKVYPENQTLSSWVYRQRLSGQRFKRGQESDMTLEHMKRLDEIGFIWDPKKSDEWKAIELRRKREDAEQIWQKRYAQLVQFKSKKGHTRVPKVYPANSGLSSWVFRQRGVYKKMMNGEEVSGVTPERLKLLLDIGFDFGVRSEVKPSQEALKTYLSTSKVEQTTTKTILDLWRSKYNLSDDNSEDIVQQKRDVDEEDKPQKRTGKSKRHGAKSVTSDEDQHAENPREGKKRRRKA